MAAVRGPKPCRSGIPNKFFSFLFTEIQSFIPIHEIVHSNEMVGYSVQVEFKLLEDKRVMEIQITKKPTGEYVLSQSNN